MQFLTITKAYILWVLVGLTEILIAVYTGELQEVMSQMVDSAGEIPDGLTHDQLVIASTVVGVGVWLFGIAIGALFVWMTNRRKRWAMYLLTGFCLYQIALLIYGAIIIQESYDVGLGFDDWFFGIVSLLLLLYIAIVPHKDVRVTNVS